MLRFTIENQEKLNDIYFHDSLFFNYTYSYEERAIELTCTNEYVKKEYSLRFNNVVYHEMIGCCFWGENACSDIYWAGYSPCEDVFAKLSKLQAKSEETKDDSFMPKTKWNTGVQYVPMLFEFFTGDTLTILAEEILVEIKELQ